MTYGKSAGLVALLLSIALSSPAAMNVHARDARARSAAAAFTLYDTLTEHCLSPATLECAGDIGHGVGDTLADYSVGHQFTATSSGILETLELSLAAMESA